MSEVLKDFSANIDLKQSLVNEDVKVVEGDNGNVLVLNIVKDGSPVDLTDCIVLLVFAHSGRTVWQDSSSPDGGITISGDDNNIVTVRLHSDSYAPNGITVCQVQVYSGTSKTTLVSSARFSFKSELSLLNAETVESIEQYSILVTLIESVNSVLNDNQPDWDETNVLLKPYIKNKPVAGTDFQAPTQTLTDETTLSDTDTVPFYDASATAHRKSTWANIVATITALFRSIFMPYDATSTDLLINGNFSVNQRVKSGTVTLSAGQYGHDRWKAGASGCTYTFATSENVTTLTISAGSLIQVVEGINLQSGTVCLSWVGTAQGKIGAGSYSASGVTGTATGGTNLNIEFNTGTLSKVQLNYGSVALPFVPRSFADELRLSERYYEKSYNVGTAPGSVNALGFHITTTVATTIGAGLRWILGSYPRFKVRKRIAPTITLYTVEGVAGSWFIATADRTSRADIVSENGFVVVNNTGGSSTTSVGEAYGHWVADAEL